MVILGMYLQSCPKHTILPWKSYYFFLRRININSKDGHAQGYWEARGANMACMVRLSSVPWGPSPHIAPDIICPKKLIRPRSSKITAYTERFGGHGWRYNKITLAIRARSFWAIAELRTIQWNYQGRTCLKHTHKTTLDFDIIFPKEKKK